MEKRDLYDKDRNFIGKTIYKGEDVPEGYYYLTVMTFMENVDGRFLIQKTSKEKGGDYSTTGGHPKSGEDSFEGLITEVKEELGIDISNENIILVKSVMAHNTICDIYYVKMDIDLDKIVCQKEEVDKVLLLTTEEIKELIEKGIFKKTHSKAFLDVLELIK